jgi:site-specific DNA recombinase
MNQNPRPRPANRQARPAKPRRQRPIPAFDGEPWAYGFTAYDFDPAAQFTASGAPVVGFALAYLRVSSRAQMETDTDPDGNSIQTQREHCKAMADRTGHLLIGEYVEPGNSATSIAARPVFQALLERIKTLGDVDAVIIYKRSRAFRDDVDAALTKRDFADRGVRLVSATDYTDETPEGQFMAGILDQVNTYFSKASGADIRTKMEGKAKRGGTPGKAKLGYLNTRKTVEGRKIKVIETDPVRGPLITLMFERYATGQYGEHALREFITDAGLRTRPTEAYPAGRPLFHSEVERILTDRTYLGLVVWKGEEYPGEHEPLVKPEVFDCVQNILAKRRAGTRERTWDCYLKGLLWCARCGRRLVLDPARSHTGRKYFYFRCVGLLERDPAQKCDLPRTRLADVEQAVEAHYATLTITEDTRDEVAELLEEVFTDHHHAAEQIRKHIKAELRRLDALEDQLIELLTDRDWPVEKLTAKQRTIRGERAALKNRLAQAGTAELDAARDRIERLAELLIRPRAIYRSAPDDLRKTMNFVCFEKLYIDVEEGEPAVTGEDLADTIKPFTQWLERSGALPYRSQVARDEKNPEPPSGAQGSIRTGVVVDTGIEPVTPRV